MPTSRLHRHLSWLIPVGGFLIALAVFGHRIGRPIAWTDEGVTYVTLQRTWANLMPLWQGRDSPLFPYYVLAKLWSDTLTGLGWTYSIALIRGLSAVALAGTTVVLWSSPWWWCSAWSFVLMG